MWFVTWTLLLGCPKDRTGLSATSQLEHNQLQLQEELKKMDKRLKGLEFKVKQWEQSGGNDASPEVKQLLLDVSDLKHQVHTLSEKTGGDWQVAQFQLNSLETRLQQLEVNKAATNPLEDSNGDNSLKGIPNENYNPVLPNNPAIIDQGNIDQGNIDQGNIDQGNGSNANVDSNIPQNLHSNQAEETAKSATTSENTAPKESKTPDQLLEDAKTFLKQGDEEQAEVSLETIFQQDPTYKEMPEVRYRYAEAAFNRGDFAEAARRFKAVEDNHSNSRYTPWAMLRQAESLEKLGKKEEAKLIYQRIVDIHPKSGAAKKSKDALELLSASE